jgi:hypothetical protein
MWEFMNRVRVEHRDPGVSGTGLDGRGNVQRRLPTRSQPRCGVGQSGSGRDPAPNWRSQTV